MAACYSHLGYLHGGVRIATYVRPKNVLSTMYRLYIGSNVATPQAVAQMASRRGTNCTISAGFGIFRGAIEPCTIVELMETEQRWVEAFCDRVREEFPDVQEILVTSTPIAIQHNGPEGA